MKLGLSSCSWISPPSTHHAGGALDRARDRHVCAAAAFQPAERLGDLVIGRLVVLLEESSGGHDPAVETVAAQRHFFLDIGELDRMRLLRRAEAGEGFDLAL